MIGTELMPYVPYGQSTTLRVLLYNLSPYSTGTSVKEYLENQGYIVKYTNMKFCVPLRRCGQLKTKVVSTDSITSFLDAKHLASDETAKSFSYCCYVEMECTGIDLTRMKYSNLVHDMRILPNENHLFPTAAATLCVDVFHHILSFFHSPPFTIPEEHRDNSYNLLVLQLLVHKQCCFQAFLDSSYLARRAVAIDGMLLKNASQKLQNDKDTVRLAVESNFHSLQFASKKLQHDEELQCLQLQKRQLEQPFPCLLKDTTESMKDSKNFVMEMISAQTQNLQFASDRLKGDKDVVLAAVKKDGHSIVYANDCLKNDKHIVFSALGNSPNAFKLLPQHVKNDKEVVLFTLETNHWLFAELSEEMKNDKEVVFCALKMDSNLFVELSEKMKRDKEVVLFALKMDCKLFSALPKEMKDDKEVVLFAFGLDHEVFYSFSNEIRNNKEVMVKILSINGLLLQYVSKELRNDFDVVMTAIKQNIKAKEYIGSSLLDNESLYLTLIELDEETVAQPIPDHFEDNELVINVYRDYALQLVSKKGHMLKKVDSRFHRDTEFMEAAVAQNPMMLAMVSATLREDVHIVLEAVNKNGYAIRFASKDLQNSDEIIEAAKRSVVQNIVSFTSVSRFIGLPETFLEDRKFVLEVVAKDGLQLEHLPRKYKENPEFVFAAVISNKDALKFAPDSMKEELGAMLTENLMCEDVYLV